MTRARDESDLFNNYQVAGKNFIPNGNFDFWSRGTSFTGGGYTADHWNTNDSLGTMTVTKTTNGAQVYIPSGNYSYCDFMINRIDGENLNQLVLQGSTTLSWYLKTSYSGLLGIRIDAFDNSGTRYIYTTSVNITASSNSFNRYSITIPSVPFVTGTANQSGSNGVEIHFVFAETRSPQLGATTNTWQVAGTYTYSTSLNIASNSNVTLEFSRVQWEQGSVATTFSRAGGNYNTEALAVGPQGFEGVLVGTNLNSYNAYGVGQAGWSGYQVAGKNKVINGDFNIWQRGTSFTNPSVNAYVCDRWRWNGDGSGGTQVWSQQTFTPGTAPVAGYEGTYFMRYAQTSATTGNTYTNFLINPIEDARVFAGQTVTLSFWAKSDAARTISLSLYQAWGVGGSTPTFSSGSANITTTWSRYTFTTTLQSASGKTIGTLASLQVLFQLNSLNTIQTIDIWGVQLEAGTVATPFTTSTGSPALELLACQRYFSKSYDVTIAPGATSQVQGLVTGAILSVANGAYYCGVKLPVTMRTGPTITIYSYSAGTVGIVSNATGGADYPANTAAANTVGHSMFSVYNLSGSTVTSTAGFIFHYTASAEL